MLTGFIGILMLIFGAGWFIGAIAFVPEENSSKELKEEDSSKKLKKEFKRKQRIHAVISIIIMLAGAYLVFKP